MDRYKPGDTVKIRSWESMKNEFGVDQWNDINTDIVFVSEMRWTCGKRMRIRNLAPNNLGYNLHDIGGYIYSPDTFVAASN